MCIILSSISVGVRVQVLGGIGEMVGVAVLKNIEFVVGGLVGTASPLQAENRTATRMQVIIISQGIVPSRARVVLQGRKWPIVWMVIQTARLYSNGYAYEASIYR